VKVQKVVATRVNDKYDIFVQYEAHGRKEEFAFKVEALDLTRESLDNLVDELFRIAPPRFFHSPSCVS
jgi:hypothetical protein